LEGGVLGGEGIDRGLGLGIDGRLGRLDFRRRRRLEDPLVALWKRLSLN
jgi:hypothetical protein